MSEALGRVVVERTAITTGLQVKQHGLVGSPKSLLQRCREAKVGVSRGPNIKEVQPKGNDLLLDDGALVVVMTRQPDLGLSR